MAVKRRTRKPRARKTVKKVESKAEMAIEKIDIESKIEPKVEPMEAKRETKEEILFPDRKPIFGGDEYVPSDTTNLTRDGKPWVPEEHGYVARFMDPDVIDKMGWRGYQPVPVEAGIRVADHPLTAQEIGTGDAGKGIYYHPKTNEAVQEALGGEELTRLTGGKSNIVKLNSSILALAPIELVTKRRKFAKKLSNESLRRNLMQAHEEAQEELGLDTRMYGRFSTGRNAERIEMDAKTKSPKKVWSVPAQIK